MLGYCSFVKSWIFKSMEHLLCEKPSIVKKFSDQHAIVHSKMQGKKNIIFWGHFYFEWKTGSDNFFVRLPSKYLLMTRQFWHIENEFHPPFSQDFSPKPLQFVHKITAFQTGHMMAFKPIKFGKILWKMSFVINKME